MYNTGTKNVTPISQLYKLSYIIYLYSPLTFGCNCLYFIWLIMNVQIYFMEASGRIILPFQ